MSPQTTLFGVKLPSPVLLAPVGVQGILHEDGELATASCSKGRGSTDHVFCEHAFDRSCFQGQRRRSPVVPAILVRTSSTPRPEAYSVRRPRSTDVRLSS
jgi:hypothetical protein